MFTLSSTSFFRKETLFGRPSIDLGGLPAIVSARRISAVAADSPGRGWFAAM